MERQRTLMWVRAVEVAAKAPANQLEPILGADGKWEGLWSRYIRGVVSPSNERVLRIERKLGGTGRYFFCPLWGLLENREFHVSELRSAANWVLPELRDHYISSDVPAKNIFWRERLNTLSALNALQHFVEDKNLAVDVATLVLILLREAELHQDALHYLFAMRTISTIRTQRTNHDLLCHLPDWIFRDVSESLRNMEFPLAQIDDCWNEIVIKFCETHRVSRSTYRVLDAINYFPFHEFIRGPEDDLDE